MFKVGVITEHSEMRKKKKKDLNGSAHVLSHGLSSLKIGSTSVRNIGMVFFSNILSSSYNMLYQ